MSACDFHSNMLLNTPTGIIGCPLLMSGTATTNGMIYVRSRYKTSLGGDSMKLPASASVSGSALQRAGPCGKRAGAGYKTNGNQMLYLLRESPFGSFYNTDNHHAKSCG
jgi:hypothetical protein